MPTIVLASWDDGQGWIEIDIDANVRVTAVRRIGTRPATLVMARPDGSRSYTMPSTVTELIVGTAVANRIQLTYDPVRDRYDGMAGEIRSE